jgi:hypothetical protein
MLAGACIISTNTAAGATRSPARSGTILGYYYPFAAIAPGPSGCEATAECAAWLASGCNPRLAGHNPGIHASIVNVRRLASWTNVWRLRLHHRFPDLVFGGVTVQLWGRHCQSRGAVGGGYVNQRIRYRRDMIISPGTVWMTITSTDNTTIDWYLRRR